MDFIAYSIEHKCANAFEAFHHWLNNHKKEPRPSAFSAKEQTQMKREASGTKGGNATHRATKGAGFIPKALTIKPNRRGKDLRSVKPPPIRPQV